MSRGKSNSLRSSYVTILVFLEKPTDPLSWDGSVVTTTLCSPTQAVVPEADVAELLYTLYTSHTCRRAQHKKVQLLPIDEERENTELSLRMTELS